MKPRLFLCFLVTVVVSPMLFAQLTTTRTRPALPLRDNNRWQAAPETYGTGSVVKLQIGSLALTPNGSYARIENGQGYVYSDTGLPLGAAISLPAGARIEGLDLYYDDTDPGADIASVVYAMSGTTSVTITVVAGVASTGSSGKNIASSADPPVTVSNDNTQYFLYVYDTSPNKLVRGVTIRYRLQISPPPVAATFSDVPTTHPFFQYIEALAASGITAGCNATPPQYCPDAPLTRGQMAVFLARGLGLHWTP